MNRMLAGITVFAACALLPMSVVAAEDAVTAAPTLDEAFERLPAYTYGDSRVALVAIDREVSRSSGDRDRAGVLAARLAALLTRPAVTDAARRFACGQLRIIGDERQVPALARLLDEPQTAAMARETLESIPGEAATAALRSALGRARGPALAGLVNSLGRRRDVAAIPALGRLLEAGDAVVVEAALRALGAIGTAPAAAALERYAANDPPAAGTTLLDALVDAGLECAERLAASGGRERALAIYRAVWTSDAPSVHRLGGLRGLVVLADSAASAELLRALDSKDALLSRTAARWVLEADAKSVAPAVPAALGRHPVVASLRSTRGEPKGFGLQAGGQVLERAAYGDAVIAARRRELASAAPAGHRLISYLDCGVVAIDGEADGPSVRQLGGAAYLWEGAAAREAGTRGTVAFDGSMVRFLLDGLDPQARYAVGLSWWDFDANGRSQSVEVTGGRPRRVWKLLPRVALPDHAKRGQAAAEWTCLLPPESYPEGRAVLGVRREGASNALVSELWLYRLDLEQSPVEKRVLIVTGIDYPGHDWRATAPVLREIFATDARVRIEVTDDPGYLASPELARYDSIVLHFMDWEQPDPGEPARAGLKRFVADGGGLVLVHFACGAFQEWPDFVNIAGRVWDPKLRGHDPRGPFRVAIRNHVHPVTKGLVDFDTDDELYTCLRGEPEIDVLADARSKVDGKDYPMAFVLGYGKGRVFSTTLGHDVKAFRAEGVGRLLRRGLAWASGLQSGSESKGRASP